MLIVKSYIDTSELVGNILSVLMTETLRNPELIGLLEIPWQNIEKIIAILEQYQNQREIKQEPLLHSISVLLGPLMVRNLFNQFDRNLGIPAIDPEAYIEEFLCGRII